MDTWKRALAILSILAMGGCSGDPSGRDPGDPDPFCGDGIRQAGEECDEGADNADAPDACRTDCTLPACGDGVTDAGEDCDDGDAVAGNGCEADCTVSRCGDGIAGESEACDAGAENSDEEPDACRTDCSLAACGDAVVDSGEECDDDNADELDNCTASCRFPDVVSLSVGFYHTCAILAGGNLRCWGLAALLGHGVLDTRSIGDDETPAVLGNVDVGGRVVQVSSGELHTCALLEGGSVRCWGRAADGQLGYGNTDDVGDDETPASAGDVDVGGRVVQIAAGSRYTCALLEGGRVRCWGDASLGQLGHGNTETIGDDETPASAGDVDIGGVAVELVAGSAHTCVRLEGGQVRCWGAGTLGRLGYGNTETIGDDETPASAGDVDIGGPVARLAAGGAGSCALLVGGGVRCWGPSSAGQLGYGNTETIGDDEAPASAGDVDVGGAVVDLSSGIGNTCALLEGGRVRCWGVGEAGANGHGNLESIGDDETPASAGDIDVGGTVVQVSSSIQIHCAVLDTGSVRCWGNSTEGRLGYGNVENIGDDETPASAGDVPLFSVAP